MKNTFWLLLFVVLCDTCCQAATPQPVTIKSNGETIIEAKSGRQSVRVTIRTREIPVSRTGIKRPDYLPSTCKHADVCSIVDSIDILVNDKKIIAPHSLISNLAWLTKGEVRFDTKMMMLLSEGDASESYFVKIEFDQERVLRMVLYADSSMKVDRMLADTTYYLVVD